MNIGWIGLGVMGAPMATRLQGKHSVFAYDRDTERLHAVAGSTGMTVVAGVPEVAAAAEVVFLSLPSTGAVRDVVDGPGGLTEHLSPGDVIIDVSTTEPEATRLLATSAAKRGIGYIDAPVSGGQLGAESGSLSIMCGGPEELIERFRPLMEMMGRSVVRVGDTGSGGVAKLVNNMIVGAAFTSIAEGLALSAKAGIDPGDLHAAIRGGWAGSPVLDVTIDAVTKGDYSPGGTVDLLSKDLGYARNLARSSHIPVPVTAIVDEVFTAAIARGDGPRSQPVIVQLWEDLLGINIGRTEES